jgi:hypothetical protein
MHSVPLLSGDDHRVPREVLLGHFEHHAASVRGPFLKKFQGVGDALNLLHHETAAPDLSRTVEIPIAHSQILHLNEGLSGEAPTTETSISQDNWPMLLLQDKAGIQGATAIGAGH